MPKLDFSPPMPSPSPAKVASYTWTPPKLKLSESSVLALRGFCCLFGLFRRDGGRCSGRPSGSSRRGTDGPGRLPCST
jgi:hypothetical protein